MTDAAERDAGADVRRRSIAELERLHAEMTEARAPATEGLVVNRGRPRSGRLVFGDATE